MLLLTFSSHVSADEVEINGIRYYLITKGNSAEAEVRANGYTGDVQIPPSFEYEGVAYNVISIGENAFYNCTGLTSVIIPDGVTSIGKTSFMSCGNMNSITIPSSVNYIGEGAFSSCSSLASVTIPSNVTSINASTFVGCKSLKSIIIPSNVTSIGNYAFRHCSGITTINIPSKVKTIGNNAFEGCSGLTSMTIPNNITSMGENAFSGCFFLYVFNIKNINQIRKNTFSGCTALKSIIIPNSVTSIRECAFGGCSGLISVTLLSSLQIYDTAFKNCQSIEDVYCYAEQAFNTYSDAFYGCFIEYATLHVPGSSINAYESMVPWKSFGTIVVIEGTEPEIPQCSVPIINYENDQLIMSCATEGAEFVTEIIDEDVRKHYDATITLSKTYVISVYATKAGYDNSDITTATLCWIEAEPTTGSITTGVNEIPSHAILIQNNGGIINFTGAIEGKAISVYNLSGQLLGSATATSGTTTISTSLSAGETCIVKIGDKSVKVLLK